MTNNNYLRLSAFICGLCLFLGVNWCEFVVNLKKNAKIMKKTGEKE